MWPRSWLRRSTISSSVNRASFARVPVPAAYGLLAAALAAIAMLPSLRPAGWSLTVLPRVGEGSALAATARQLDPGFRLVFPRCRSVRRSALP